MPQGAIKKKSTAAKLNVKARNRQSGPKKGRHTTIAPKKKSKVKQAKAKKELEKAIRGRIEEEITSQASKSISNFSIVKPSPAATSTQPAATTAKKSK
ncbi:UPF0390 protein zgc136864-like [Dysidea avara]|uniref:UPF0390 protein zgc136864-like n=1 Tax=Dysidea avara TaxID=196820 RepID=UPI00332924EB